MKILYRSGLGTEADLFLDILDQAPEQGQLIKRGNNDYVKFSGKDYLVKLAEPSNGQLFHYINFEGRVRRIDVVSSKGLVAISEPSEVLNPGQYNQPFRQEEIKQPEEA